MENPCLTGDQINLNRAVNKLIEEIKLGVGMLSGVVLVAAGFVVGGLSGHIGYIVGPMLVGILIMGLALLAPGGKLPTENKEDVLEPESPPAK